MSTFRFGDFLGTATTMADNPAALLVANYSNTTGYAWGNIYRLYNSIARTLWQNNIPIYLSFASMTEPLGLIDDDIPHSAFIFDPYNITLHSLLNLYRAIKAHNIRYIYLTDMRTWHWLYAILRLWGVKRIVVHCRISVADPLPPPPESGVKKYLKTMLNSTSMLRADFVYAISDFVRNRIIHKNCYPQGRVIKILNGIDTRKFECPEKSDQENNVVIFCCARASKHKGIMTLIEATRILKERYQLHNFVIQYAGDGPDLDSFKAKAEELNVSDSIIFLGQLESTQEHACNSDIIVVPSQWGEGFASTVAEGMAAGKAVIATLAGGIPEVVGGPEYGILVPPGNSELLAAALFDLIENDDRRKELGLRARQRAVDLFDETQYHRRVVERLLHDFLSP